MTSRDEAKRLGWATYRTNRIHHPCIRWTCSSSHDEGSFWGFTPSSNTQVQDTTGFPYLKNNFDFFIWFYFCRHQQLQSLNWNRNTPLPSMCCRTYLRALWAASILLALLLQCAGKVLVSDTLRPGRYEYMHWFNAIAWTFVWAFTAVSNHVSTGKRQWENLLYLTQT